MRFVALALALLIAWISGAFANDYRLLISDQFERVADVRQVGSDTFIHTGQWQKIIGYEKGRLIAKRGAPPRRPSLPDMIPHAYVAIAQSAIGQLVMTAYTAPTRRYAHGALGDDVEGGVLSVTFDGVPYSRRLSRNQVFEDIAPRLFDMDGDGDLEIVTIRSQARQGAAVVIYKVKDAKLQEFAASKPIGKGNRWLNIAGIADFDGDGDLEIAIVVKPHIEGTLQLLELSGQSLKPRLSLKGFSNHAYGDTELRLSAVADLDGDGIDDLLVPDFRRQNVVGVSFAGDSITNLFQLPVKDGLAGPVISVSGDETPVFLAVTSTGRLAIIARD